MTHLQSARADPSSDPTVMMFTWWVGTLWLLMYDDTDGLLGPREEVYEFKGAGWWTVPMPEPAVGVEAVEADAAAHAAAGGDHGMDECKIMPVAS